MNRSDDEHPEIMDTLEYEELGFRDTLVTIYIPSHDLHQQTLPDQDRWRKEAMELCSELWSGATAVHAHSGVYRDSTRGIDLWDEPILVNCYADKASASDKLKRGRLLAFLKRMCRDANQAAVAVVIAEKFYLLDRARC